MGYVESSLGANETILYRAHLHWKIFLTLKAIFTLFISPLIERATSEFAVTNRRLVIKVGLVSRRTLELNLAKVESIGVDQSLFGRIFGFGTITVIGTGGTREPFKNIAHPLELRRAVNDAAERGPAPA
jgi:uncharacterized membrane protein YdbT with pleckstrin-like domain